jgi:glutathione synthase/RimK-type ligase-like ATP-grasp enzyme
LCTPLVDPDAPVCAQIKAEKSIWILKPQASSCGRGIRLVHKDNLQTISPEKKAVVQRYLSTPHLINGHKYDLRLYVLVTSTDPLRVYIFQHGLVRFSTNK